MRQSTCFLGDFTAVCVSLPCEGPVSLCLRPTRAGDLTPRRLAACLSQLHDAHELVWRDPIAPELCVDFDAAMLDNWTAVKMWFGGLTFFGSLLAFTKFVEVPEANAPTVPKVYPAYIHEALGRGPAKMAAAHADEE